MTALLSVAEIRRQRSAADLQRTSRGFHRIITEHFGNYDTDLVLAAIGAWLSALFRQQSAGLAYAEEWTDVLLDDIITGGRGHL